MYTAIQWQNSLVVLACVAMFPSLGSFAASDFELTQNELICGPRCVQYVLGRYHIFGDLVSLVEELQWPAIEQGCSLADIAASLQKRGLSTVTINLPRTYRLNWNSLAVVHLLASDEPGSTGLGHFVVWLPNSSSSVVHYWNGLEGEQTVPISHFRKKMSGPVLLVSSGPIVSPLHAVERDWSAFCFAWWVLPVFAILVSLCTACDMLASRGSPSCHTKGEVKCGI